MNCECDGTGWVPFVGKYKYKGKTLTDVEQVVRCRGYLDYFRESELMQRYPEKVPVAIRSGACPAAIDAHKIIHDRAKSKERQDKL